jgi:hypothetical protein
MQRSLQPELLDSLPPDHPDALHNRRDLRIINFLMGNPRWFARTLPRLLRPDERALELGAGVGELGARLIRKGIALDGLDLWPRPAAWPTSHAWHRTDLVGFQGYDDYGAVIGNMIFHQFSAADLVALGARLRKNTRVILACEPARQRQFQLLFAAISPVIRANHVSRHDAHVSIAAGFLGQELPDALELDPAEWDCQCVTTLFGAYRMIAVRRP